MDLKLRTSYSIFSINSLLSALNFCSILLANNDARVEDVEMNTRRKMMRRRIKIGTVPLRFSRNGMNNDQSIKIYATATTGINCNRSKCYENDSNARPKQMQLNSNQRLNVSNDMRPNQKWSSWCSYTGNGQWTSISNDLICRYNHAYSIYTPNNILLSLLYTYIFTC